MNLWCAVDAPFLDQWPIFTPHRRFDLLPVGASE